jgi:hypothetical protein
MSLSGGACGLIKKPVPLQVLVLNTSITMTSPFHLDTLSITTLNELFINKTLTPIRVHTFSVLSTPRIFQYYHGFQVDIKMEIYINITDSSFKAISSLLIDTEQTLLRNKGRNIAEFVVVSTNITSHSVRTISPIQEILTICNNSGDSGSYYGNTTTGYHI